jgi:hypothetical protein
MASDFAVDVNDTIGGEKGRRIAAIADTLIRYQRQRVDNLFKVSVPRKRDAAALLRVNRQ